MIKRKLLIGLGICMTIVIGKSLKLSPTFPPPHTVRESFQLIRRSNKLFLLIK